jgi:spore germination cell wall hydrolase CwlJ-like protein
MRRVRVIQIASALSGACFWAAAILLPSTPDAQAQSALAQHPPPGAAANPAAAYVRTNALAGRDMDREIDCLALNVYFEARGEPMRGRYAVAAVTLNRVAHPDFPDSICQVVKQGAELGRHRCQFSWACDANADRPRDAAAWAAAREVAFESLFMDEPDPTDGALYFHATRVRPSWSSSMVKVAHIGKHVYYREPMTVAGDGRDAS